MPPAPSPARRPDFLAYGEFSPAAGRTAWVVCGRARARADGSLVVSLDLLPSTGELHLRPLSHPPSPAAQSHAAPAPPVAADH
jgi:hypothetical protein